MFESELIKVLNYPFESGLEFKPYPELNYRDVLGLRLELEAAVVGESTLGVAWISVFLMGLRSTSFDVF